LTPPSRAAKKSACASSPAHRAPPIVPWIAQNDTVQRGERISLIQFGSRVEVYLPRRRKIKVNLGDKVVGGEP